MWFAFALLVTLVVAQTSDDPTVSLKEELLIGARYDETHDRLRNLFSVERLDEKTFGLDAVLQAQLFTSGGNIYIGTSMYNNYVTYKGPIPILQWNSDDETFENINTHPDLRPGFDAQNSVYYFTTSDQKTWAYDALYTIQNSTTRSIATLFGNGTSFILPFNSDGSFGPAAVSFSTNFSTSRSGYFQNEDGREFLWTFSWGAAGAPAWNARTPVVSDNRAATTPDRCTVFEYTVSGGWQSLDMTGSDSFTFSGCPAQPRPPLTFQNVNSNWVYFFPSFSAGGGVLTLNYRGASGDPQWEPTADVLDGLGIPAADKLFNWVDDGYDMITASSAAGIRTYRLHWDTHYVEELPMVPTPQGTPYDFSWYNHNSRQCFVVGQAGYSGLTDITPVTILQYYLSIYCWDQSRDVWDLAIRFPAEFTWFNQVFQDPNSEQYYLVTMSRSHLTNVSVKLYKLDDLSDDYIHIRFYEGPSVALDQQTYDQGKDARNIAIASLAFLVFITLILLVMLLMSMSKGGAGGSSDYSSFG